MPMGQTVWSPKELLNGRLDLSSCCSTVMWKHSCFEATLIMRVFTFLCGWRMFLSFLHGSGTWQQNLDPSPAAAAVARRQAAELVGGCCMVLCTQRQQQRQQQPQQRGRQHQAAQAPAAAEQQQQPQQGGRQQHAAQATAAVVQQQQRHLVRCPWQTEAVLGLHAKNLTLFHLFLNSD